MFLMYVEVGEHEFDNFVRCRDKREEGAVDSWRVGVGVVGAAERATLLAVRRREADARTTCTKSEML